MRKLAFLALLALAPLAAQSGDLSTVGVVNFKTCIEKSKLGQAEQKSFEELKTQMGSVLEKTEKELEDISNKLNDAEYLDSLSKDAQNELKNRFQNMGQEMARYQNQYYQILNQANFKLIQELGSKVADASKAVATTKKLNFVMNEDAFFYYAPGFDITNDVVAELDKRYEADAVAAKDKAPAAPPMLKK